MTDILVYSKRFAFKRYSEGASGFDLCSMIDAVIKPWERLVIPTGVHVGMPVGIEAQVRPRSGLARDHGVIAVLGTIDSDYRGEVGVTLLNLWKQPYTVSAGQRVAQLVFAPVLLDVSGPKGKPMVKITSDLKDLSETVRGSSGYGSSGSM